MSTEIVNLENKVNLGESAMSWPETAKATTVTDRQTHMNAGQMLLGIKDLAKKIKTHHAPLKEKTHQAWKATVAAEKRMLTPLQQAESILKLKIGSYVSEERRRAEVERRRLETEERQRQEEEQLRAAVEAEEEGATEQEVQAVLAEPVVAPVVATSPPPKVQGISTITTYRAEVTDLKALVAAVASGAQPTTLIEPNLKALNQMARALKTAMNIPGVRVVAEETVRAGRR